MAVAWVRTRMEYTESGSQAPISAVRFTSYPQVAGTKNGDTVLPISTERAGGFFLHASQYAAGARKEWELSMLLPFGYTSGASPRCNTTAGASGVEGEDWAGLYEFWISVRGPLLTWTYTDEFGDAFLCRFSETTLAPRWIIAEDGRGSGFCEVRVKFESVG